MALRVRDSRAKALETGNDGRVPDPDADCWSGGSWSGCRDGAMNSYDYGAESPVYPLHCPARIPLREGGNWSWHLLHLDGLYVWAQPPAGGLAPSHVSCPSIPPPGGTLGESTMAPTE